MPTYAYTCTECGHAFDIHQSFSDAALTECPACGGRLRKVFSSVGVVFKGSGFYRTDSRSGSSSTTAAKTGGSTSTAASSGGSGAGGTSTPASSTSGGSGAGSTSGTSSAAKPAAG